MLKVCFVLVLLIAAASANEFTSIEETLDAFRHLISLPQRLARNEEIPQAPFDFHWDDCSKFPQLEVASEQDSVDIMTYYVMLLY